jgi:hypothetical protein
MNLKDLINTCFQQAYGLPCCVRLNHSLHLSVFFFAWQAVNYKIHFKRSNSGILPPVHLDNAGCGESH